jgi:hypothetical protein
VILSQGEALAGDELVEEDVELSIVVAEVT